MRWTLESFTATIVQLLPLPNVLIGCSRDSAGIL